MILIYIIRVAFVLLAILSVLSIAAYPLNRLFGGRGRDWEDMLRHRPLAGTWWIFERFRPQILRATLLMLPLALLTLPFGD